MTEAKEHVASAIARAQAELEETLSELEKMPAFAGNSVASAAHAINNYLSVSGGAIELIKMRLADYPDSQVRV